MANKGDNKNIISEWADTFLQFSDSLRINNELCDLTLLSSDLTQFSVHSLVLSAASPVIKNLVLTNNTTLSFPDISHDVWVHLLELIYTGTITDEEFQKVDKLMYKKAADLLELHPILRSRVQILLDDKDKAQANDSVVEVQENDQSFETKMEEGADTRPPLVSTQEPVTGDDDQGSDSKDKTSQLDNNKQVRARGTNSKKNMQNTRSARRSKRKVSVPKIYGEFTTEYPSKKLKVKSEPLDSNLKGESVKENDGSSHKLKYGDEIELENHPVEDEAVECDVTEQSKDAIDSEQTLNNKTIKKEVIEIAQPDQAIIDKLPEENNSSCNVTPQKAKSGMLRAPEAIISIVKKLERKAKKQEREKLKLLQEMKEMGVVNMNSKNLVIKCMFCGENCKAECVKCLLCLERIAKQDFLSHIQLEHPYFTQDVCWVSCTFKTTPVMMSDKKERIIAKKLYLFNNESETDTKLERFEIIQCSLCEHRVETILDLRQHMKNDHDINSLYMCTNCGDVFKNPGCKREHQHYCDGGLPLECKLCGAVMDGHKSMWSHMKTKHEEPKVKDRLSSHYEGLSEDMIKLMEASLNEDTGENGIGSQEVDSTDTGNILSDMKKMACISCGDRCEKDVISCMLCASNCDRTAFMQHIEAYHGHCPTRMYWYRCRFVYKKQGNQSDERVIGRQVIGPLNQGDSADYDHTVAETTESTDIKPNSKVHFQCVMCQQICRGITTFGKHCRFDHDLRIVLVCKYCKDVFRSVTMRDKHQSFCGEIGCGRYKCETCDDTFISQQSFVAHNMQCSAKQSKGQQSLSDKSLVMLQRFLRVYSTLKAEAKLESVPDIQYGNISTNSSQNSVCLKCAKNKHLCTAPELRCFICFQNISSKSLDLHLLTDHPYLQGSQCFGCPYKKSRPTKHESFVIGFNMDLIDGENVEELEIDESFHDDGPNKQNTVDNQQIEMFTCAVCNSKMQTLEQFAMHTSQSHSVTELYSCKVCPMIFTSKLSRDEHEFYCSGKGVPFCVECDTHFTSPFLYKKHTSSVHSGKSRLITDVIIKCQYCDTYENKGESRYRNHLRMVHKKDKFFLCKTCFQLFDYAHTRDEHAHREHSSHTPLCQQCGQTFETPIKLQRHINYWHKDGRTKEKVKRKNVILKVCQHCGKGFKLLANLNDHVNRYHLHYKPYACNYCDKTFYHTFARKKHEFKDHGAGYYECFQCGHRVYSRWDLKKHEERAHGIIRDSVLPYTKVQDRQMAPVMFAKIKHEDKPTKENEVNIKRVKVEQGRSESKLDQGYDAMEVQDVDTNWSSKEQVYFVNVNYKQSEGQKKVLVRRSAAKAADTNHDASNSTIVHTYSEGGDSSLTTEEGQVTGTQYHMVEDSSVIMAGGENQHQTAPPHMLYQVQDESGKVYQIVQEDSVKAEYIPHTQAMTESGEEQQGDWQDNPTETEDYPQQGLVVAVEGEEQLVDWQSDQGQEAVEEGQQVIYVLQE